ncbi:NAD-dependent epimerase/dehydratase [Methylocella silvestris BL2]|uniref:NAD-dependent epimerase/dehydratase n=1 Tax=Methylocella silvestris (strain DSM 15510 / CIP 108128 / LMG 27833 / NCIMB 13906 / BL2) TaxID=395965 RepID=B8ERU1_METSB|nr:NAD-dependent epimerase/dehydratase family protein [Methylocella silvestris]ACK51639.1 NAD-dependent epimerase/dehydratase [Methylocella silvestris BL2]
MTGKALVTGASGFLGRALVPALLASGASVIAAGRGQSPFAAHPRLAWRRIDLADPAAPLREITSGVDCIYHLAWSTVPSEASLSPAEDARANIVGSLRIIESIAPGAAPRLIFASSGGAIYGRLRQAPASEDHPLNPISAYGLSKRTVEAYLDLFADTIGLRPASLRIGNLFGPGQNPERLFGAVTQFSKAALTGAPIILFGDGSTVRDYVYIDDAVDALIRAAQAQNSSRALNIGSGEGRSLNDIIACLEAQLGRPVKVERRPPRPFDTPLSILDPSRARREIGWSARVSFEDGVARTLKSLADAAT